MAGEKCCGVMGPFMVLVSDRRKKRQFFIHFSCYGSFQTIYFIILWEINILVNGIMDVRKALELSTAKQECTSVTGRVDFKMERHMSS
jgi:hypothetical protein